MQSLAFVLKIYRYIGKREMRVLRIASLTIISQKITRSVIAGVEQ